MIRVAAVGDLHFGRNSAGGLAPHVSSLADRADLLLLAGDLTNYGLPEETKALAEDLTVADLPVVAVLGNHDIESDQAATVTSILGRAGVEVLEGTGTVLEGDGLRVGVAGTIGFGGGFPGATCADFGEAEFKAFARRARTTADSLEHALTVLDTDVRIALTHYSPVRDTLTGEHPELYPFLGTHLLAEAIDRGGADIAFHGHAHHGSEEGRTAGGVPVRNVARPVIGGPYALYEVRPQRA